MGAILAAILGLAVYERHENSRLRKQMETLQSQLVRLTERSETLQKEHADATNRVVSLADANEHLQRDTALLPKLRAEVTRLNGILENQKDPGGVKDGVRENGAASQVVRSPEALDDEQKRFLAEQTGLIWTKNSVADLERLKDSLARWDELITNIFPAKMTPVLPLLKQRVAERVMALEEEAEGNSAGRKRN